MSGEEDVTRGAQQMPLWVAGVDEVGRGPLVGAVVAAAVILDPGRPIDGLTDSKRLTERRRERLDLTIRESALCWALGRAEAAEIDDINILQASLLAMQRAVTALSLAPGHVQVDGNRCPRLACSVEAVVRGDLTVPAISAASIVAKVARDREMMELHDRYPEFGFARHKGYPTREHLQALRRFGPIVEHRRSFAPVRAVLATGAVP
jgi:ribonuclease HII